MIDTTQLTSSQWIVLSITSLITFVIFYVRRKYTFWERRGIKGPKPIFPFGNTLTNLQSPLVELHKNYYKKYGKIYGTYDGLQPHLHIGDPELIRTICVKDFNVFPSGFHTVYLHPVEVNFLTNLFGNKWKRMRSMLSPAFTSGKIRKMFLLMKICTNDAQKAMLQLTTTRKGDFEPKQFWVRYNADVIAKCCFAANLDVYNDHNNILLKNFSEIVEGDPIRILFILTVPEWLTKLFRISLFPDKNIEFLRNLTLALIEKRKNNQERVEDFLQSLIDSESIDEVNDDNRDNSEKVSMKFSFEEIASSSLIFLLAGYETTSTLLTWACYRLAINPEVQEKLFAEVSKVDTQDYEVISGLTYLDAVINETLRIDPPIVVFQRTTHEDYILPGTEIDIPKYTRITIPIRAIHHDPDNFSEPEVYKPERFINESPKSFTFLPFGTGSRTCLGMRFALINAKLSLANFVKNYKILPTHETPMNLNYKKGSLILSSQSLKLKIESRD